ncbi:MAG: UvrD-helicase domain-containing protein [Streptosporangiaceae bacterium]
MARLAIARGFLGEYAKLDRDVQVAVDAAISAFARHPQPGRHLAKPQHTRDTRIRLLPVDDHWRGVVLAPPGKTAGDTYCLVTVLPQDQAEAYATSHRFSVNRVLGVLEVRDEEAIESLQPDGDLQEEQKLFADVTDAGLARLGVDPQLLPTVRRLTKEEELEALEAALPAAQYAALRALADGMSVDEALAEVVSLVPGGAPKATIDPDDLVSAMERAPSQVTFVSGPEELQLILAHPFAAWRTFLHPSQREIAYLTSYAGPAQVTGGPGTGKTVTVLHRAAFLAERIVRAELPGSVLLTTFNGNLADVLATQLDLLVKDSTVRSRIEVVNVDRLAYRVIKEARGTPVIADERMLRERWAQAAEKAGLNLTPAFLKNEWEQVILAQDLRTAPSYLTCLRTGRGRPLTKAQRSLLWQAAQQVTAELAAASQTTHLQMADEAAQLLRLQKQAPYRHILVDEAQDLHPSQWRLLRAAVTPGPDDLFIAADPHQRVFDNRVSLASLRISVRGRSRRLSLNYRTTAEILAWAVPLLGIEPVTGLDGEVDSLLGYRSPMHGPRPQRRLAADRAEEFKYLNERVGSWIAAGIEPHAIGVAARSAALVREARAALEAAGLATVALSGRGKPKAVRAGTMQAMKGLEFQAVAVVGVEEGVVPAPAAVTPVAEDAAAHAQDLQRERCVLFVACTRARDHLYVSGTGQPSVFLPSGETAAPFVPGLDHVAGASPAQASASPAGPAAASFSAASFSVAGPPADAGFPDFDLGKFFRLLRGRRRFEPGLDAEAFLAWATTPGRRLRLAGLDEPARQFLAEGGDEALDLTDRCLDLLDRMAANPARPTARSDRLTVRDPRGPDLSGVRLPARFVDAARKEAGPGAGRSSSGRAEFPAARPARPPRLALDPNIPAVHVILPAITDPADEVATWQVSADGDPVTVRSPARSAGSAEVAPPAAHPLPRPVRVVHVALAGSDHASELAVVPSGDPVLFFAEDGRHLPGWLPLPPGLVWILHPDEAEPVTTGDVRMVTEAPSPWPGWQLRLVSLEQALSVSLPLPAQDPSAPAARAALAPAPRPAPVHPVRQDPRPRLVPGVPLPGVSTPYGLPVYPEPPRLELPGDARWHVAIRPAAGGAALVSRELAGPGDAGVWDGLPRPILGEFDIAVRGPLGRSLRTTVFVAEGATVPDLGPADHPLITDLHVGAGTEPVIVAPHPQHQEPPPAAPAAPGTSAPPPATSGTSAPPLAAPGTSAPPLAAPIPLNSMRPKRPVGSSSHSGPMGVAVFVSSARPVASGAEISSGQLTIRGCVPVEGLTVALYLDRAPWRAPVVVPVPADGVVKLPPEVRDAGPLRVLLRAEDPYTPVNWPDWPGRDAFACAAPGLPASGDLEEDALSRFLAGERDLPVRPRRVEHLWRLLHLAADLIATGAPADLRERCSAALVTQPSQALTGLLDSGLDTAACVTGLIRTGLAAAQPVMMDNTRAAERLWDLVPAAAAVLCSRMLAGPEYPDEDPVAVVLEAAHTQCGPALAAILSGNEDPYALSAAGAAEPALTVVPQPLLDAATRTAAARQLSADVFRTPALARAAQDAATVVSSAERLLAASPYRAAAQLAARHRGGPAAPGDLRALPAMSASLAMVARIAARGDEACRGFERSWRSRWTDLAWQAPTLASIDLVLAEAHLAAAERARFGLGGGGYQARSAAISLRCSAGAGRCRAKRRVRR